MRKNLKWLMAAIVAGLLIVAIAIPVMAQDGGNTPTPALTATPTPASQMDRGNRFGMGGGQAVLDLLGMTRQEVRDARQAGKSLVQMATEKGYTEQDVIDVIIAAQKTSLAKQVAAGKLTQAQADEKLTQLTEQVKTAINSTAACVPGCTGQKAQRNGPGGMMREGSRGNRGGMCDGSGQMNRGGQATPQATTTPTVY